LPGGVLLPDEWDASEYSGLVNSSYGGRQASRRNSKGWLKQARSRTDNRLFDQTEAR